MNFWNCVKKPLWILLIVCPLSTLCGQSISGISAETDSAIRAEFLANARRIHADLIKADFAQQSAALAIARFASCQDALVASQAAEQRAMDDLATLKLATAAEATKRKKYQLEAWIWRGLASFGLYLIFK
ncbi:hypothetical protein ACO2Q8_16605 [Larkinella sp. VNQ87]|uniref:hypothetical protein n=1 Tax=Larkinella sp. VNQ87 TaxID=3400921 RepID=UPI003BFFC925